MQYETVLTNAEGGRSLDQAVAADPVPAFSLSNIIAVARRRKWAVIGSVFAALLISLVVSLLMTPQYTATAVLEIKRESGNFTNVEAADQRQEPNVIDPEFYETQAGLLRAQSLATRVIAEDGLQDKASFFRMLKSNKVDEWFDGDSLKPGASRREDRLREASELLLKRMNINIQRLSRLASISVTLPDAALAKRIADSWGRHFIQATLDRRYAATAYARKFLEDRLSQLRTRIDQAERDLVAYAAQKGIVTLPAASSEGPDGQSTSNERSLVAEDLLALNRALAAATAARIEAQSRLGEGGGTTREALANQGISEMRARRAELNTQYADMLQRFEPDYPPAAALRAQIAAIDRSIAREENRVRATLRASFEAAQKREKALTAQVEKLQGDLFDFRRRSTQYNILLREVDTNRQLYDALLQRYKEIGVAGGVGVNNISVVDAADLPDKPSSPKLALNLALALVAGLVFGAALAFGLEQLEDTLSDPTEVPERLGVPLVGVIPKVEDNSLEVLQDPKSALSEACFSVRTALALATTHGFPQSLAITSSRPAEGKSTTSLGIAKSLASSGRRVVLIDCDMRSPSLHGMVGAKAAPGVSNILAAGIEPAEAIQQTPIDNLWVIAAGPQPPSAAELLAGNRLGALIEALLEKFDNVVVDAPPVMGFADAPLIASQVLGVCFVVEAHATGQGDARTALSRLSGAHTVICGAIVTKFDVKRAHYGYGYNYGYGYGDEADAR